MPMFDFHCPDCDHIFEKIVPGGTSKFECPKCGALSDRQVSAPAAPQFKGTGFYATDYKGKP